MSRLVTKLRSLCLALPEAYEEEAWVGTRWRSDEVGMRIDDDPDWDEVEELVTESYRVPPNA